MSVVSFLMEFQRRAGIKVDGQDGPETRKALDRVLPATTAPRPTGGLKRIVMHWTAGTNSISELDRLHYHFIVGGDGAILAGVHQPEANINTADGAYAAHTLNCNTGSIGVAVAGMAGAVEAPFSAGGFPIREAQVAAFVGLIADLCRRHSIDVTPQTVLTHAEVQPTLGITQRGKWDIRWLPGMNAPGDPIAIGNILRGRVLAHMKEA